MNRALRWIYVQDAALHAHFAERYPSAVRKVDTAAEWLFGIFTAKPFGVILGLLLVLLKSSEKMSTLAVCCTGLLSIA
jgi:hypothetical protein